ncbi:bifunctional cytidylyltransferase/SDR family oxidoreductase [Sphaerisporangium rubeum]|uniref:2-C-methyl-D-erythritol 4-phosphate cytidylyltransferase n=1 Tax=Sphaerisporangium rubeum TaxID=321317 RepID=A0A7X0IBG0_9ACTN|nr:IspD/TarI family cytidylyltransferase [Sphaerisporangium rubeum]MBB6472015.1 2-C-methyl-D-erythritol 4-phosphate cytidylyltransferase [Sphaerisporangium rubeum]
MRTVAVVLAGGVGQRAGLGMPKQLARIAGRTIIEHTVAAFEAAPEVDEIVVLMAAGHTDEAARLVAGFPKVSQVIEGGASRTETTWRALSALGTQECRVLLHDAVRPFVEPRVIADCVAALETSAAVMVAVPTSDTIVVTGGDLVRDIPDRAPLRRVQTPQCFLLSVVREAYTRALADPAFASRPATDDCGVVLRYLPDVPIRVVAGSEHNMKVTHPVDFHIAEKLFQVTASVPSASPETLRQVLSGRRLVVFGDPRLGGLAAEHGALASCLTVPVSDAAAVREALAEAAEAGPIDAVVLGAGTETYAEPEAGPSDGGHVGASTEADPGQAEAGSAPDVVIAGHLGALHVAEAALPYLRDTHGQLLLHAPAPTGAAGVSAAAAVAALTRFLAEEWSGHGVRVNCVTGTARTSLDVLACGGTGLVIGSG